MWLPRVAILSWKHCIIRGFSPIFGYLSQYEILISLECAVDSEWNGVIISVLSCSVAELFNHKSHKSSASNQPWTAKITLKYLDNRTCCHKLVCTILFSSRWWVYWYDLFSVLSTLQKLQILMKRQVIRGFCQFWVFFITLKYLHH